MTTTRPYESAAEFLSERRDFIHIYTARSVSGEGWDVVMRIDGTYFDKQMAEEATEGIRQWFDRLHDIPRDKRIWWNGPPFKTSKTHTEATSEV